MVNDKNPEIITSLEAIGRTNKAAQSSGVVVGPLRVVGDQGHLATDPDLREMSVGLTVRGADEAEIHASFGKFQAAVDATDGIQLMNADREVHGLTGAVVAICYYAKNTGRP